MSDLTVLIGTLSGTALGAGSTYLTQRLQERRAGRESLREARRKAYLELLASMHSLFLDVRRARLTAREDRQQQALVPSLARIEPLDAQQALDLVRLAAPPKTVAAAEELFKFLRSVDDTIYRGTKWHEWHMEYRALRRNFLGSAQSDLLT